ncbi:MAG: PorT family protein [Candidatus Marinimicrobia bacterium]|nr:PorT family protein [Candidatus Neomarinimicrobiota bacterium]
MRLGISLIVCLLFCQVFLFGTDYLDVIYLKNGDVAKGMIVENVPNDYVKLEIPGGTILTFKYSEIERFAKEKIETSTKTNKQSTYSPSFAKLLDQLNTGEIQKGIKAGINMGKFIGDDVEDNKYSLGFALGGFLLLSLNEQFIIRPELLYTQRGSKYEESEHGETYTATYEMNYLDCNIIGIIPIQNNINLTVGPSLGFYLGGKVKEEYDGESYSGDIDEDLVESPDFGLFLGGTYGISPNVEIELRYYIGLRSVDKLSDDDIRHSAFQLTINYSL